MPSIEPAGNAPADELDNLFNYDVDDDDPLRPYDTSITTAAAPKQPDVAPKADLGIDEEITVANKRKPVPKLDEDRLLSQNGIPKLHKITKSRLKLKGKGHEFSDVARLLALYQLWLDDLYPRAKFADGLAMVEKLGHSKSMQKKRKEWIHETKSRTIDRGESEARDEPRGSKTADPEAAGSPRPERASKAPPARPDEGRTEGGSRMEEALFISDNEQALEEAHPMEDELDQLLAEDAAKGALGPSQNNQKGQSGHHSPDEDDFTAEMDVLAEMGW